MRYVPQIYRPVAQMTYWCDDARLGREQRRRDTRQERARRRLCAIELRRGGWFIKDEVRGWSGPWASQRAAELARDGKYDEAHVADREARR